MNPMPSRRGFLAATAAVAAAPLVSVAAESNGPSDTLAPEPPLPPGVARQLGSARFRDIDFKSVDLRFSADSKWLIGYDGKRCVGYEVRTGGRVQFATPTDADWFAAHWLPTTDGRLTVVEHCRERVRLRRYDLPAGRPHPSVEVHGGAVAVVSADGRVVVIEGSHPGGSGCWGVNVNSGATAWECLSERLVSPFEPTGRLASVGVLVGEKGEHALKLLDLDTGRAAVLQPPEDERHEVHTAWATADGKRAIAHLLPFQRGKRWVCAWDTKSGKKLAAFEADENDHFLGPTADGMGVFAIDGRDGDLVMLDVDSGEVARRYGISDSVRTPAAVTPDAKSLLVGYPDNPVVRLIDAATGKPLPQSPDPPGPLVQVFFPSRSVVAAAFRTAADHYDYTLYDLRTGRAKRVIDPEQEDQSTAAVHPDGRLVLLPGDKVSVYDPVTKTTTATADMPPGRQVGFWLDARTVGVFTYTDLHTWEPATGKTRKLPLKWPKGVDGRVHRCRPTADGRTVIVYADENARLGGGYWHVGRLDLSTGELTTTEVRGPGENDFPAMSADGGRVVVLPRKPPPAFDDLVEIDAEGIPSTPAFVAHDRDGRKWLVPVEHPTGPFDLSACGRTLVTQSAGPNRGNATGPALEYWEVATGRWRMNFPLIKELADLRCSPCGRFVGTVRADTPLYLWDIYGETSDPKPEPTAREHAGLWDELAVIDAARAFAAVRRLVQHPATAVAILKAKLTPAVRPKAEWVAERIVRLSDRDYHERMRAERELAGAGDVIADELKAALAAGADTEEADVRLERLVAKADRPADWLRQTRAVEVLEYSGDAGRKLLKALAGGAAGAWLTREAAGAVGRTT